jgi:hypothetical protein
MMTSMTTKLYGAVIGTVLFFALGTAMAHASDGLCCWMP